MFMVHTRASEEYHIRTLVPLYVPQSYIVLFGWGLTKIAATIDFGPYLDLAMFFLIGLRNENPNKRHSG